MELITDLSLNYIEKSPETDALQAPLIILFHGIGSNEADLFSFSDELPSGYRVISTQAPYPFGMGGYAWFNIDFSMGYIQSDNEQAESSRKLIINFIEELRNKYSIENEKIVLMGFSQGAVMSYLVSLTRPDLVSGVLALSGYVLDDFKTMFDLDNAKRKLKFFVSHGTQDDVLPVQLGRISEEYLRQNGLKVEYKEYPMPHGVAPECLADAIAWIKREL